MAEPRMIRLPDAYHDAYAMLARKPEILLSQLASTLRGQPEGSSPAALSDSLRPLEDSFAPVSTKTLLDSLVSINVLRSSQGWTTAESAAEAVAFSPDLDVPDDFDRLQFMQKLMPLLNLPILVHLAKAFDLGTAYERSVRNLRIVTDIRPIFEDDPRIPPTTAIVGHSLILNTYDDRGGSNTTIVTLDAADLESLLNQAIRAKQKAVTLRAILSELAVTIHDLESQ